MKNTQPSHTRAVLTALFVTFLWSLSWVLIKTSLSEIPPLLFAGLRYVLAVIVLLPLLWKRRGEIKKLHLADWGWLALLGLVYYTFTQGGQFLTLQHLDAIPFSLILNFTTVFVALVGIFTLGEIPGKMQWLGMGVFFAGVLLYFWPLSQMKGSWLGYGLAFFTMASNAGASLLGRGVNRREDLSPLTVTVTSMGLGSLLLLGTGLVVEGLPHLSFYSWGVIVVLAVVNTALAFTLWNRSLQVLSAVESSMINNTMLVQISLLAWAFLGESVSPRGIVGLLLATAGSLLVSVKRAEKEEVVGDEV